MTDDLFDEAKDMSKTLEWILGMIMQSGPEQRRYIAGAYHEAQELVASIPLDDGGARPRIVACIKRSDLHRAVQDIACVGWILSAVQERVNEKELPDWRKFRKIIKQGMEMLSIPKSTIH